MASGQVSCFPSHVLYPAARTVDELNLKHHKESTLIAPLTWDGRKSLGPSPQLVGCLALLKLSAFSALLVMRTNDLSFYAPHLHIQIYRRWFGSLGASRALLQENHDGGWHQRILKILELHLVCGVHGL